MGQPRELIEIDFNRNVETVHLKLQFFKVFGMAEHTSGPHDIFSVISNTNRGGSQYTCVGLVHLQVVNVDD